LGRRPGRVEVVTDAGRQPGGDIHGGSRAPGLGRAFLYGRYGPGDAVLGTEVQHRPVRQLAAQLYGPQGEGADIHGDLVGGGSRLHRRAGVAFAGGDVTDGGNILTQEFTRPVHFFFVDALDQRAVAP